MKVPTIATNPIGYIGVGFKPRHYAEILAAPEQVGWLEIHAENYMIDGGPRKQMLRRLASQFPISVHGVGMSIGGEGELDAEHLLRLRTLLAEVKPFQFSEHLAWSSHDTAYMNDLLPLPYTQQTLKRIIDHIDSAQQFLGYRLLLENPSTYVRFSESTMSETDFLAEIVAATGCGLLLDINNVFISAHNQGYSDREYIDAFPLDAVGEIHMGGHEYDRDGEDVVIIDSHNNAVANPVWDLYDYCLSLIGPRVTLIEWDADVPEWPVLAAEVQKAARIIEPYMEEYARVHSG